MKRFLLSFWMVCLAVSAANSPIPQTPTRGTVVAAGGGIAFVQVYGAETGTPGSTHTVSSVVVPANAVLVVFASQPGDSTGKTISSVTFNTSESFTAIQTLVNNSDFPEAKNSAWILVTPTATTANVVVTWSGAGDAYQATHVLVYTGVENDAGAAGAYRALTTPDGSAGTGADASVAATSGDWIVSGTCNYDDGAAATLSALSHTSRRVNQIATSQFDFGCQDTNGTVGGTTSMTWTADEFCTHIAFALIPDS